MGADAGRLDGKVAIVTGAAGGIGQAIAELFAGLGAAVLLADIDDMALDRISAGGAGSAAHIVDLAEESSIEAMIAAAIARFGRIDIVINNAADQSRSHSAADSDIAGITATAWDRAFTVNLRGTMLVCHHALPHMLAQGGGAIVNMASNLGLQGSLRGIAYSASKAAIVQLTRSIAASHGPNGIRANSVSPGLTLTEGVLDKVPAAIRVIVESETLTTTLGTPIDIAHAVAFLASDAARYVNGENLVVDGGTASHIPGLAMMRAHSAQKETPDG